VSHAKLITDSPDADTSMACSNVTKAKVLGLKKTGETYDQAIFRICTEYESMLSMGVFNEISRST
jgi:hypothetical protein